MFFKVVSFLNLRDTCNFKELTMFLTVLLSIPLDENVREGANDHGLSYVCSFKQQTF